MPKRKSKDPITMIDVLTAGPDVKPENNSLKALFMQVPNCYVFERHIRRSYEYILKDLIDPPILKK